MTDAQSPSLIIRRIVVTGDLQYDQSFNDGLSVIAAEPRDGDETHTNKSGKTALVELIGHALGRQHQNAKTYHFAPIIDELGSVYLEVEANGETLTIERSLRHLSAKLIVRNSPFFNGIENTPGEAVDREALSPLLLQALRIPSVKVKEVRGDLTPLSFPLLMRAFVLHQDDSFGRILDRVIPDQRVSDVLGFLTKATPIERFKAEEELADKQKQVMELTSYYENVVRFTSENRVPPLDQVEAALTAAQRAVELAGEERRRAQVEIGFGATSTAAASRLEQLRNALFTTKQSISEIERKIADNASEVQRLTQLSASLRNDSQKVRRIRASRSILSTVDFGICPRCLLEITPEMKKREDHGRCSLCNRTIRAKSDDVPRSVRNIGDVEHQIDEAEKIIGALRDEREDSEKKLGELRVREATLSRELDAEMGAFVSPALDRIVGTAENAAVTQAEVARLTALREQALQLHRVRQQLDDVRAAEAALRDRLNSAKEPVRSRVDELRRTFSNVLRDVGFPDLHDVTVDPYSLLPSINGQLYVHVGAALRGLAVVCYHLALLQLSRRTDTFFPRMLVIDSPAVGDLNRENHDRLLNYLSRLAEESGAVPDWQIILTTRRTVPALKQYVIDNISARPNEMLLKKKTSVSIENAA